MRLSSSTCVPFSIQARRWFAGPLIVLLFTLPVAAQRSAAARKELNAALSALRDKQFDTAIQHFQKAVQLEQEYKPSIDDYLDDAAYRANKKTEDDYEAALDSLDKALTLAEQSPDKPDKKADIHYMRGWVLRRLQSPAAAARDLETALKLKPDHLDAADEIGKLYEEEKAYNLAIELFEKLSQGDPKNGWFLYHLGRAHQLKGSFRLASDTFKKAIDADPTTWTFHTAYVAALEKLPTEQPIARYEELLQSHSANADVKLMLAKLYVEKAEELEEQQGETDPAVSEWKEKALVLLRTIAKEESALDRGLRKTLARDLEKAGAYDEAADQLTRLLEPLNPRLQRDVLEYMNLSFELGKVLVKANKADKAIPRLFDAMQLHQETGEGRVTALLFYLGKAHWQANKKDQAELYFRRLLAQLDNMGYGVDFESAELLGDIYLEDQNYPKAVDVFQRAVNSFRRDHPSAYRLRLKLAQAHFGQGAWVLCIATITEAKGILEQGEVGKQSRLLLARAYLKKGELNEAADQLRHLEKNREFQEEVWELLGGVHLAAKRPDEALPYIELAYQARPHQENLKILHAGVLDALGRYDAAQKHYAEVLAANPSSQEALIGLGDLQLHMAEGKTGAERVRHLEQAVASFQKVRDKTMVLERLGRAERDLAKAEADVQAQTDRLRLILYTSGYVIVILVFLGLALWLVRRIHRERWARRCFEQVLQLERDLKALIRRQGQARWSEDWQRHLGEEPFKGRIDYKALCRKAEEKKTAADLLDVTNFGHLVGILDSGWDVLGVERLAAPGTKRLVIANLSYVGDCRNAIFHARELLELEGTAEHDRARQQPTSHMNEQVLSSITAIRANLNLSVPAANGDRAAPPPAAPLPVLAPVMPSATHIQPKSGVRDQ
ncbi:MAG: tetratricopeptide repeat protein [Gemmataceae bacterium]